MRCVRNIFYLIIAGNFVASVCSPAVAGPVCVGAGESQSFNIIGLKSTLMVDALSCGMNQNYDSFMVKFQPQILQAQHQMDDYFVRAGGLAGQSLEDGFTTQLANSESDAAAAQGAGFCGQAAKQFAAVAGLGGSIDLVGYAVKLSLANPPTAAQCPAAPFVPAPPPVVIAELAQPAAVAAAHPKLVKHKHAPTEMAAAPKHPNTPPPSPYMLAQTI